MRIYLACNVEKVPEKTRKKMSAHADLLEAVGLTTVD